VPHDFGSVAVELGAKRLRGVLDEDVPIIAPWIRMNVAVNDLDLNLGLDRCRHVDWGNSHDFSTPGLFSRASS
jgi:hypothetical protein